MKEVFDDESEKVSVNSYEGHTCLYPNKQMRVEICQTDRITKHICVLDSSDNFYEVDNGLMKTTKCYDHLNILGVKYCIFTQALLNVD